MIRLVNYFRMLFCKHEFEMDEYYCDSAFRNGQKISLICKKYGGGGHKNAAGFTTNDVGILL